MGYRFLLTAIAPAMLFGAGAQRPEQTQHATQSDAPETPRFELVSTIAFSNTFGATREALFNNAEIFLLDRDGTNPRQLTENQAADAFPTVSPDGKKLVFDSNRLRDVTTIPPEPLNTSDLFVMNADGTEQTHLIRGASPTWSSDSKRIAFHASASGTGRPILITPGSATSDSDLFVADVDDLLSGVEAPRNVTNSPEFIDDDPDWSPDGGTLVFTRHDVAGNHMNAVTAEIYALDVDGTGAPRRLTFNGFEERAPDISPDGTRIVFMCRVGDPANPPPAPQVPTFELCVISADGTGEIQRLTTNQLGGATPNWSPNGEQILFHRNIGGVNQLFVINPDDIDPNDPADPDRIGTQITSGERFNQFPSWDLLRVKADR
jgi:Tol biopolymer transport system component